MSLDVLIVDDSAAIRKILHRVLMQAEVPLGKVHEANDGMEALEKLKAEKVGLILSDINMPNMNGFELCERIRGSATHKHLPVVALTSLASDEHVRRGNQVGVSEYLIKLDRDKLVLALTAVLSTAGNPSSQQMASV